MEQLIPSQTSTAATAGDAGRNLKKIRVRLGLTTREVEEATQKIAALENNSEFFISNVRLTQIENDGSLPSVYKIYSLAAVYQLPMEAILRFYGIDLSKKEQHRQLNPYWKTRVLSSELDNRSGTIHFPIRFDPGFHPEKTVFLSRLVQAWDEIPVALLTGLDLKRRRYGYVGLEDRAMYPLIRPGSIVQIDDTRKKPKNEGWGNEFERPIYFIELRYSYECSWCHQEGRELTLIPHPVSGLPPKTVRVPDDGEILGQVTGVAMRISQ